MKTSFFRTLVFALLMVPALSLLAGTGPIQTYNVNLSASKITWRGYKMTGQHYGVIALKSGSLQFQDGVLTGGKIVADMTSIESQDLSGEYKQKLEGHLKSDDFFGVATYPNSSITFTKVTPKEGNLYDITADLTIKSTTQKIQFQAKLLPAGDQVLGEATLKVDRAKFDVRYGSPTFFGDIGDKAIADEFDLTVNIVASK